MLTAKNIDVPDLIGIHKFVKKCQGEANFPSRRGESA